MTNEQHTMDSSFYCGICGRTWDLRDATMANIELMFTLSEQHTHNVEEITIYHTTAADAAVNFYDETDDD